MYKILKNTPFGFILELQNDYCYSLDWEYSIYINDDFYMKSNKNVISIYGLKSNTDYKIKIIGIDKYNKDKAIDFDITTEKISYLINIKDYNATGDGITDDTSAINLAIYTAPKKSVVYFPKGTYLVNQILLMSDVDIYLEKGVVIKQNINRADLGVIKGYQKNYVHTNATINASWEGYPLDTYCSLIYGKNVENIHIYGEGIIDGNGFEGGWWDNFRVKNIAFRPKNIFYIYCKNITISGITSQNSASWNIHPMYSDDIFFYGLNIKNEMDSPNTDGLNPESCSGVKIIGCKFSVGDDCIAIKSGKYYMSVRHYKPTDGVFIKNCYMTNGHGGVVIGSEMSCGVKNVLVEQCYFKNTDRGLRIKTRRGRGNKAVVDRIKFKNIIMDSVTHCIVVNMFYFCDPDGYSDYVKNKNIIKKDNETPSIRNIEIKNLVSKNISGSGFFVYGLPESRVENITIKDSSFAYAEKRINECPAMMEDFQPIDNLGIFIKNGEGICLENNTFIGEYVNIIDK